MTQPLTVKRIDRIKTTSPIPLSQDGHSVAPRTVTIKYPDQDALIPAGLCEDPHTKLAQAGSRYRCEPLLVIDQIAPTSKATAVAVKFDPNPFLSVSYHGRRYATPEPGNEGVGRTYQVFNVVTQLVGLNKSAKNLPTTSVFTLVP